MFFTFCFTGGCTLHRHCFFFFGNQARFHSPVYIKNPTGIDCAPGFRDGTGRGDHRIQKWFRADTHLCIPGDDRRDCSWKALEGRKKHDVLLFPFIGQRLELSQEIFGNWAAIAIHDTSSVVGAGAIYGEKALQVATTVKLIRALWIIPLSIVLAFFSKNGDKRSIKFPWFILLFVAAIFFANIFPAFESSYAHFSWLGRRAMVVALFLIGSNITICQIKQSGTRCFLLGITLWVVTAVFSLFLLTR